MERQFLKPAFSDIHIFIYKIYYDHHLSKICSYAFKIIGEDNSSAEDEPLSWRSQANLLVRSLPHDYTNTKQIGDIDFLSFTEKYKSMSNRMNY